MNIIPVILSGGSGTRLWPVSRRSRPKQFLSFGTEHSLFQETVLRCRSKLFDPRPVVVGSEDHRFLLAEDLLQIGVEADILLEPVARNSCPAIAAGAMQALGRDSDAMILVLAADHYIPDTEAFAAAVEKGAADAAQGRLVTFGIDPDHPATGYGYIAPGKTLTHARSIDAFVEKPDAESAAAYLEKGYLWNSGNFLFRADAFLGILRELQPVIHETVSAAFGSAQPDLDFLRLDPDAFAAAPSISVDYAVMERTDSAAVLPVDYAWSDIGSWNGVGDMLDPGPDGNTVVGDACILEGSGNLVMSNHGLTTLIGVNDMAVVTTRDAVLVVPRQRAEAVRELVDKLVSEGRQQAVNALQIFRPWGNYEQLDEGSRFQVKRIEVKPGGVLSLQKHRHRAENWVVVSGEAEVTIGSQSRVLKANEATFVPRGEVHRLANRGSEPLVLIEVQTGDYFGEDDIIRLDDHYNRKQQPEGLMD